MGPEVRYSRPTPESKPYPIVTPSSAPATAFQRPLRATMVKHAPTVVGNVATSLLVVLPLLATLPQLPVQLQALNRCWP